MASVKVPGFGLLVGPTEFVSPEGVTLKWERAATGSDKLLTVAEVSIPFAELADYAAAVATARAVDRRAKASAPVADPPAADGDDDPDDTDVLPLVWTPDDDAGRAG